MSINVNDKNLGHATAYAYYKAGGGTMTEAEFTEFMADFGTASQTAVEAAQAALASKNAAQTAATTATNKATEATTAATTATTKAAEASTSASTAASAKDTAVSAASTATTKATEATTAAATAVSAKDDAVSANTAAQSAKTAAQTAQTGAETAAASVSASAAQIQTNADDISELKEELTAVEDAFDSGELVAPFTWESGAIGTSTGLDAVNSNYVRTKGFYKTHNRQTLYNGCDQTIQVFYYNLDYSYDHFENHSSGSTETLDANYPYFRMRTLATVDNVSLIVSTFDVLDGIIARADKQQNLTNEQKAQLRSNIGVSSSGRIATKKIAIIGDSLSDWDYAPTTKWMSYLRDIDGYTIDNQAVSGSGYLNGSLKGGTSDHYFYNQALRIANDCDMVVVFGSLNDISRLDNADATIGTVDDTAVTTLCGAFNTMVNNILSINPNIIIMVVIPCPWNGRRPNMSRSDASYQNVMDYTAMIKTLCEYNSIPCLDLFHESGLRPWLEAFRTTYYQNADGTHPNELGQYTFLYPQIRQFIKRLNNDDI